MEDTISRNSRDIVLQRVPRALATTKTALRKQYTRAYNQLRRGMLCKEEFDYIMESWCCSNNLDWKEVKNNWRNGHGT